MKLTAVTDILFITEPDPATLRDIAARAFEVDTSDVAVGPLLNRTPPSDFRVIFQRQPENAPGDFPVWYGLAVDQSLVHKVGPALDMAARQLGLVALSDAEDDESMTLHLADGSAHIVHLEPDADEAFRITPEIRQIMERVEHSLGRRHRSSGHAVAN